MFSCFLHLSPLGVFVEENQTKQTINLMIIVKWSWQAHLFIFFLLAICVAFTAHCILQPHGATLLLSAESHMKMIASVISANPQHMCLFRLQATLRIMTPVLQQKEQHCCKATNLQSREDQQNAGLWQRLRGGPACLGALDNLSFRNCGAHTSAAVTCLPLVCKDSDGILESEPNKHTLIANVN